MLNLNFEEMGLGGVLVCGGSNRWLPRLFFYSGMNTREVLIEIYCI